MASSARWRELLSELTRELEHQSARLRELEAENKRLQAPTELAKSPPAAVQRISKTPPRVAKLSGVGPNFASIVSTPRVDELFTQDHPRIQKSSVSLSLQWDSHRSHLHKPAYIIDPESAWYASGWQGVVGLALAWVAVVTPLQIGLLDIRLNLLFVTGLFIDVVFLVDLILQFFVMISVNTFRGLQREVRLSKIGIHYLKRWFLIDFLAVIPWDLIGFLQEDSEHLGGLRVVRALWMLKMLRLIKPSRLIHKIEIPYSIPYQQQLALLRFLFALMFVCHWLACVWSMTLKVVDEGYPRWIDDIQAVDATFGFEQNQFLRTYIAAFYFCSYTMTSVGYGDVGPQNILERIVCTMMVMLSGLCWAYVIGQVCAIVADIGMHHLNMMMEEEHLPHELKSRVRQFFLHNRDQARHLTQQSLLDAMSPQLKAEVATVVNFPWLERVTFFNRFMRRIEELQAQGVSVAPYRACIADIVRHLKSVAYAQGEFLSVIRVLGILSKGLALRSSRLEHKGAVWGEDFVLSNVALVRPVNAYALTYLEVLCLSREDLMSVIEQHNLTCPKLGQIVRRYCVRVAVRRGILAEARLRSQHRHSWASRASLSL